MSARRSAVSYSRFSDPKQASGDSSDRQERLYRAFCERHNLTPGKEVFADRGVSGYRGANRTRGKLGLLIDAAKSGAFDPGTVVVIEAWDRLGRQRPDRQTELVAELLRTGVSIGVCRLDDIFTEEDFGTHKWTTLAVFIQLAHQESKQKAERVAASWERRRQRAREEGKLVGARPPAWIELVGGKLRLIPERAAVVRQIFRWAAEGLGHTRIIKALQAGNVLPFGKRVVREGRNRSQFSGVWTKSYVALLLRDRRVVGEYQPLKGDDPDGPPIAGYFPAVVTEDEYNLARAAQQQRFNRDSIGRRSGPRQGKYVNVFKGMFIHPRDGEGYLLHNKGTGAKPDLILMNAMGNGGRSKSYTFPYYLFEELILRELREVDPGTVLPRSHSGPSVADSLRAKLAKIREDIARIQADLRDGYSKALVEVLRSHEAEEERTANELQDELARTAKPLERAWNELPSLIDFIRQSDDPDRARLRVRQGLRAVIDSAALLIVPRKSWRFAVVQFFFVGGSNRLYMIAHQAAANRRTAKTFPVSWKFGDHVPDLRNREHAAELERVLAGLDVSGLG